MRAAMVGGAAYATGKRMQRGQDRDAEQDQALDDMQQPEDEAPAAAAAPPESPTDRYAALTQLRSCWTAARSRRTSSTARSRRALEAS